MNKVSRPLLGLIFITKDEASERVAFMYPHIIELPTETLDQETQLDTNSILIESNKLVDDQRTSAEDSDGDVTVEKTNSDDTGSPLPAPTITPTINTRTNHKSENQTRSTSSSSAINNIDRGPNRRDGEWKLQMFKSTEESSTTTKDKDAVVDFKPLSTSIQPNNLHQKINTSTDSLLQNGGDSTQNLAEETDTPQRREKKNQLPTKVIISMLKPIKKLKESPFEIKIENIRYVCNPWYIRETAQCIAVVFVLHASCNDQTAEAYQNLSRKLAIAIEAEEIRCGYLRDEMHAIQPFLEREDFNCMENESNKLLAAESNDNYIPYADVEKHSSLAQTLHQVYDDAYNHGIIDVSLLEA